MPHTDVVETLLEQFPGPLTISVSIRKYMAVLAGGGVLMAAAIWFIVEPGLAAALNSPHGRVPGEGFLRLLVLLHVARDMPQALSELGWFGLIFFGLGTLVGLGRVLLSVGGFYGLSLDAEGFTELDLKKNERHSWVDVGDFDSLELPKSVRRKLRMPLSKYCVVFNDYRASKSPIEWLQRTSRNRALIDSYEYSAEDLAVTMSVWRERALDLRRAMSELGSKSTR